MGQRIKLRNFTINPYKYCIWKRWLWIEASTCSDTATIISQITPFDKCITLSGIFSGHGNLVWIKSIQDSKTKIFFNQCILLSVHQYDGNSEPL